MAAPIDEENVCEKIREDQWFTYITGVSEAEFSQNRDSFIFPLTSVSDGPVELLIGRKEEDGKTKLVKAGKFQLASISDLYKWIKEKRTYGTGVLPGVNAANRKLKCNFYIHLREDNVYTKYVDVSHLQSDPSNERCMFQVASNYNGMEMASDTLFPSENVFTTNYIFDRTQGPTASISAGAGAITRMHAAFYDESKPGSEWVQTESHQLNMLDDLPDHFTVKNGYVTMKGTELPLPTSEEEYDKLLGKTKVGLHTGLEVQFGIRDKGMMEVVKKPHQICQIFCSALNLRQGDSGRANNEIEGIGEKARFLLRSGYQGAYLSACLYECPKLFLTLIGGGVFGNDFGLIFDEIIRAHEKVGLSSVNCTVREVHIILYSSVPGVEQFEEKLMEKKLPFKHIGYVHGKPIVRKDTITKGGFLGKLFHKK